MGASGTADSRPSKRWWRVAYGLVAASFAFNALGVVDFGQFATFQTDSAQLVDSAFTCSQELGPFAHSGLEIKHLVDGSCRGPGVEPYMSQSGLPAWVFAPLAPSSGLLLSLYVRLIAAALALASAVMLVQICRIAGAGLSPTGHAICVGLLATSPWLVLFARNLYWMLPLMIAPGWLVWRFHPAQVPGSWRRLLLGVGIAFALKFLAGYEYVTTLGVSAVVPLVFHALRSGASLRSLVVRSVQVFCVFVAAFACAFAVHWAQVAHEVGDSVRGWHAIAERGSTRSFGIHFDDIGPPFIASFQRDRPRDFAALEAQFRISRFTSTSRRDNLVQLGLIAYTYATSPVVQLPIELRYPVSALFLSLGTAVAFLAWRTLRARARRHVEAPDTPLLVATWLALIGGASWFVLGLQHSLIHTHLNTLVFYLPFLPLVYVQVAAWLTGVRAAPNPP